jgi:hypothetical protein
MNPFIVQGYTRPELFCDREAERALLASHYENGRNVVILGERRMGKTALIRRSMEGRAGMAIDLLSCLDLRQAVEKIGRALLEREGVHNTRHTSLWQRFLAQFEVQFTADPVTGTPQVGLRLGTGRSPQPALESIGAYLSRLEPGFVLCLDEFQQITHFREPGAEATFREWMQGFPEVRFVFSGSHASLMRAMFSEHSRPFYQSCELLELKSVDLADYAPFIRRHFEDADRTVSDEVIAAVYHWARGTTHWVQAQCNRLFDRAGSPNLDDVKEVQRAILASLQSFFGQIRNQLSPAQAATLTAIAQSPDGVPQPTAMEFLKQHHLPAASSVRSALHSLERLELVLQDATGRWMLADPLFAEWLRAR